MIFLHLGRLWTALHNFRGSSPVNSRMLSIYIFLWSSLFSVAFDRALQYFFGKCVVSLYDRTIGVFGVLLWPKVVLMVLRLR